MSVFRILNGRIAVYAVMAVMWFCMAMGATAYVLLLKTGKTMIDLKGRSYAALCETGMGPSVSRIQQMAFAGNKPPKPVCVQDYPTY
jgi:hypothetical protein